MRWCWLWRSHLVKCPVLCLTPRLPLVPAELQVRLLPHLQELCQKWRQETSQLTFSLLLSLARPPVLLSPSWPDTSYRAGPAEMLTRPCNKQVSQHTVTSSLLPPPSSLLTLCVARLVSGSVWKLLRVLSSWWMSCFSWISRWYSSSSLELELGQRSVISQSECELSPPLLPFLHNLPGNAPRGGTLSGLVKDSPQDGGLLLSPLGSIFLSVCPALILLLLAILKLDHIGLFASTWVLLLRNQSSQSVPAGALCCLLVARARW